MQSYGFGAISGKIMLMFKKHCKLGISTQYKKKQTLTILRGCYLGQVGVIIWAKFVQHKNCKLDPDNNPWKLTVQPLNKVLKPLFCNVLDAYSFSKMNWAQVITPELAKLGPDNNSRTCVCIYIYMYPYIHIYMYICCEFRFWTNLGGLS